LISIPLGSLFVRRSVLFFVLVIINQVLSAQFYSNVWVYCADKSSGSATVMSDFEFPFQPFKIKFNDKGWVTDSSNYPTQEKYFIADIVVVSKNPYITAYLIGELTLCVECGYFIKYKMEVDEGRGCYFVSGGWYFEGEKDPAIKAFRKELKKKLYKKKGFFDHQLKYSRGNLWEGRISF